MNGNAYIHTQGHAYICMCTHIYTMAGSMQVNSPEARDEYFMFSHHYLFSYEWIIYINMFVYLPTSATECNVCTKEIKPSFMCTDACK